MDKSLFRFSRLVASDMRQSFYYLDYMLHVCLYSSNMAVEKSGERIHLDEPRYDQSTYMGRAKHFFITTNPLNIFATSSQLAKAQELVTKYRLELPIV